jgi:phosphoribosylpyrophosphate synthetase
MFDDIIDTGGSILGAARRLQDEGARDVELRCRHGLFNSDTARQSIDRVISDGRRATDIVSRIRDFSKKTPVKKKAITPVVSTRKADEF